MKLIKPLVGAAAIAALPTLGLAQDGPTPGVNASTDTVFILNSLLFLVGGFLVFFMAAGFAMLEAGLVRGKNVTMQLTKNMGLFSLASIFYYLIGYNLMYPLGTWSVEGVLSGVWGPGVLEAVGITADAADDYGYAATGSDFFFQLMFCAATASIVSGALAERIKLWPFLIFTIVLTSVIYPLQASWKWGWWLLGRNGFPRFRGLHSRALCRWLGRFGWRAYPRTTYRQIQRRQNHSNARLEPDTGHIGDVHLVDGVVRI